jgi:preprotein translocase subunit SecY
MASQAEQAAAGLTMGNFAQAKDLQKRLWFTVGALIVFRILSYVPLPGIDPQALATLFATTKGGVLDLFNNFSGGSLQRMSIIALGVMPYITASIVIQLSTSLSPTLNTIKKEGESGRKKLNQYTRYGTVALTMVQGYFIAVGLENWHSGGVSAVIQPGMLFRIACVTSLVGGTMFLMWLGEQITSRGIGNGVSLIIMAGIVSQLPGGIVNLLETARTGGNTMSGITVVFIAVLTVGLIAFICFMERAQRRVLIQYPKRATQRGVQQEKSHLPLKINTANVIPPIFASSLLAMPLTVLQFAGKRATGESAFGDAVIKLTSLLQPGAPLHALLYAGLIIFFCFFYTAVIFNPEETADNLKRHGGFIPGIRPGKNTADYLDYVLTRITVIGAAYLTFICLVPEVLVANISPSLSRLGGTGLLIVVNVTIDTVTQIQGHLLAHQYGDLLKKAKLKGGRLR